MALCTFRVADAFCAVDIAGATAAELLLGPVGTGDAGSYSVAVTNTVGTVTSRAAALTVVPPVSDRLWQQFNAESTEHAPARTVHTGRQWIPVERTPTKNLPSKRASWVESAR